MSGTHVPPAAADRADEVPAPRTLAVRPGLADRVFHRGTALASFLVLAITAGVGIFLTKEGFGALRKVGVVDFLTTQAWEPDSLHFGIAAVLTFGVLIAIVAMSIAVPVALGAALFITEVAPGRARSVLVAMVDLMAAVPSVVYGLWGAYLLQPRIIGISRWFATWLGWIPVFEVKGHDAGNPLSSASVFTASTFIAGVVVAMMAIPITCSVMREVFSQVPPGEREGAFALGATRWGMIRIVTLPFGRGGIIGGTMLGLGRALGETIAVTLIISPRFDITSHLLEAGSNSVAALIATRFNEARGFGLSALMAAGLALFVLTLIVNFGASAVIARSRSGASSEA